MGEECVGGSRGSRVGLHNGIVCVTDERERERYSSEPYSVSQSENSKCCRDVVVLFIHTGMSRRVLTAADAHPADRSRLWREAGRRRAGERARRLFMEKKKGRDKDFLKIREGKSRKVDGARREGSAPLCAPPARKLICVNVNTEAFPQQTPSLAPLRPAGVTCGGKASRVG